MMGFCFLFIDFRCIRITNSFETENRMNGTNKHKLSVSCEESDFENSMRHERRSLSVLFNKLTSCDSFRWPFGVSDANMRVITKCSWNVFRSLPSYRIGSGTVGFPGKSSSEIFVRPSIRWVIAFISFPFLLFFPCSHFIRLFTIWRRLSSIACDQHERKVNETSSDDTAK